MNGLSWGWIALMVTAPPIAGLLVAYPCWKKSQPILGNLAGTAVIFGAALALFMASLSVEEKVRRSGYDPEWR